VFSGSGYTFYSCLFKATLMRVKAATYVPHQDGQNAAIRSLELMGLPPLHEVNVTSNVRYEQCVRGLKQLSFGFDDWYCDFEEEDTTHTADYPIDKASHNFADCIGA
jgi:hypothetical protein